jgi:hypothetical protein
MITLKIDNQIHLSPVDELPNQVLYRIKEKLTFSNPAFIENERLGYSNYKTPREIVGYRVGSNTLTAPRANCGAPVQCKGWKVLRLSNKQVAADLAGCVRTVLSLT